jgi:hypothetical protein
VAEFEVTNTLAEQAVRLLAPADEIYALQLRDSWIWVEMYPDMRKPRQVIQDVTLITITARLLSDIATSGTLLEKLASPYRCHFVTAQPNGVTKKYCSVHSNYEPCVAGEVHGYLTKSRSKVMSLVKELDEGENRNDNP